MPMMNPFTVDGGDEERSVVIMDNCPTHNNHELIELFQRKGFLVEFLPRYSPNIAPHERCLLTMKESVRHAEKDLRNLNAEAEDLIEFGCQQVTPSVMRAALHECGYLS